MQYEDCPNLQEESHMNALQLQNMHTSTITFHLQHHQKTHYFIVYHPNSHFYLNDAVYYFLNEVFL